MASRMKNEGAKKKTDPSDPLCPPSSVRQTKTPSIAINNRAIAIPVPGFIIDADSDEENRSFRADDDQNIAERRW